MPEVLIRSRIHDEQGTLRLADRVISEGTAYIISCLNVLAVSELRPPEGNMAVYMLCASHKLKFIGFTDAACFARRMSLQLLGGGMKDTMLYRMTAAKEQILYFTRTLRRSCRRLINCS